MSRTPSRRIITSVRWTQDEFRLLQDYLTRTDEAGMSDLIRKATMTHINYVLRPYDNRQESDKERKERNKEKKETTKKCLADFNIGDEAKASTNHRVGKSITERKQAFWNRLIPFVQKGIYSREMVTAFYLYWTECNENSRKMRFEMEKTYELPRRLATWWQREPKNTGRGLGFGNGPTVQRLSPELLANQLQAKQSREQQSADYQHYQEEIRKHAISYAEYKKLSITNK